MVRRRADPPPRRRSARLHRAPTRFTPLGPPRRQRVLNPRTNREIVVGGPTFRARTGDRAIPRLRYNAQDNRLTYQLTNVPIAAVGIAVTQVLNPSPQNRDGDILDRDVQINTTGLGVRRSNALRAHIQHVIDTGGEFDWDTWFPNDRDHNLTWDPDAWIGDGVQTFAYGPYLIERGRGARLVMTPQEQRDWREHIRRRLRRNDPVYLPFTNVLANAGSDDACVARFLGTPTVRPADTSVTGIIRWCQLRHRPCYLYDVWGGVLARTPKDMDNPDGHAALAAVVFAGHVYPLKDGAAPKLPSEPLVMHEDETLVHVMLRAHNLQNMLYWKLDDVFYANIPEDGIDYGAGRSDAIMPGMHRDSVATAPWMDELFAVVPGAGWDTDTLDTLRAGTLAMAKDTLDEAQYAYNVSIDMTKCYYATLCRLAAMHRLWTVSVFDLWQPVGASVSGLGGPDALAPTHLFMIDDTWMQRLRPYGISSNILPGTTVIALAREFDLDLCLTHQLATSPMPAREQGAIWAVLDSWHDMPERQKQYAVINGVFGRVSRRRAHWFDASACDDAERAYYTDTYGFRDFGGLMSTLRHEVLTRNYFHVYAAVVLGANESVLLTALRIARDSPCSLPTKVKVDALFYPRILFQSYLRDHGVPDGWHLVPHNTPPMHRATVPPPRLIQPPLPDQAREYNNLTFTGAPGTGKTYSAMRIPHDIAVCFSNKGARRIGGVTIHSAFVIWDDQGKPDFAAVRDKTVFVDEAQCVPRKLWSFFMDAYMNHNTRFVFAMDRNQLTPVNEPVIGITPFLGRVINLTVDHRNDAPLIQAREQVLTGVFRWQAWPYRLGPGVYPRINMAFTNDMCECVNAYVCAGRGLVHGDAGVPYIAKAGHARFGWSNNDMFEYDGRVATQIVFDDAEPLRVELTRAQVLRHFAVAFCTTLHKRIGETISEPYCIWEQGRFDRAMMYTALSRGKRAEDVLFGDEMLLLL